MIIIQILIALLVLSILILIHEAGHFIAAKLIGVWVEEFGIGLPPRVWGKKIKGTIYSINALPFGGFVRLHGEVSEEGVTKPKKSFVGKPKIARAFVALAGIFMNFVLAVILFSFVYWSLGIGRGVKVVEVVDSSVAQTAGIKENDKILSVGENQVKDTSEFTAIIQNSHRSDVDIVVERESEKKALKADLSITDSNKDGLLGVVFTPAEIYKPPVVQRPFVYTYYGYKDTLLWTKRVVEGFGSIISQLSKGEAPKGITGPVGITAVVAETSQYGFLAVTQFMAIISINLAILNLVPFPPLDGSRVLFLVIESMFGKRYERRLEERIYTIGMAILLLLIVVLSINEIPKIFASHSLSGYVDSLMK